MKHLVALEFPTNEKLQAFIDKIALYEYDIDGNILNCILTFKQVEIAKHHGARELVEC